MDYINNLQKTVVKVHTPKISLIVPIYNTSIFLEKCLSSIRNQTFKEFEVILVNDGSTDDSEVFCMEYIKNDKRFILKSKENRGLASALNYGLKFAKGEYIGIVDSDDYISDDYCETLYSVAKEKNADVLNFGYSSVKNGNFDERCSILPKNRVIENKEMLLHLKQTAHTKLLWFNWTYLLKREFLVKNNIFWDETIKIGVDTYFDIQCLYYSNSTYSIETPFYYYVYNSSSLTQINYKDNFLEDFEAQFGVRKKFHNEHEGVNSKDYYIDISRNYLEHSLLMLLSNVKRSEDLNKIYEIEKIRNSAIYQFCFQYYIASKHATSKMKIIIYLFKYRLYRLLSLIYKLN